MHLGHKLQKILQASVPKNRLLSATLSSGYFQVHCSLLLCQDAVRWSVGVHLAMAVGWAGQILRVAGFSLDRAARAHAKGRSTARVNAATASRMQEALPTATLHCCGKDQSGACLAALLVVG